MLAALVGSLTAGCFTHHVRVEPIEMTVDVNLHDGEAAESEEDSAERERGK